MRGKSALKVALLRACVESMESWPLGPPNNKNRQKVTKNSTKSKQRKSLQRLHFPTARSSNPNTGTWTSAKSETDGTASEEDEEDLTVFFLPTATARASDKHLSREASAVVCAQSVGQ